MKNRFLTFCFLLSALCFSRAATLRTDVVTVTNNPAVANTISLQGIVFTWTNGTPASATFIRTTNGVNAAATNLYVVLAAYPGFTTLDGLSMANTNVLVIAASPNQALTTTVGGGTSFASVDKYTITTAAGYNLALPLISNNSTNKMTNAHTDVIALLNWTPGTNKIAATAPAFAEFLTTRTNAQAFTNKSFTGGTSFGREIRRDQITGSSGDTNVGLLFRNVAGTPTALLSAHAVAGYPTLVNPTNALATYSADLALLTPQALLNFGSMQVLFPALIVYGDPSDPWPTNTWRTANLFTNENNRWFGGMHSNVVHRGSNYADGPFYFASDVFLNQGAIGPGLISTDETEAFVTSSLAEGKGSTTVARFSDFNPAWFAFDGTNIYLVSGAGLTNSRLHNAVLSGASTHSGTNTGGRYVNADLEARTLIATNADIHNLRATNFALSQGTLTRTVADSFALSGQNTNRGSLLNVSASVSTLAAGANLLTRTSNNVVYFTGSPGATINAITNNGGVVADDWFWGVNKTGAALSLAHESGATIAPANCRLTTPDSATLSVPHNGLLLFFYSSTAARWLVWTPSDGNVANLGNVTMSGNLNYTIENVLVATNNAAVSNLTVNFDIHTAQIFATNNCTLTNAVGLVDNTNKIVFRTFMPQLVNRTNCYPIGNQYGMRWLTNVSAPLFTTLTQGVSYQLRLSALGTNIHAEMRAFQ